MDANNLPVGPDDVTTLTASTDVPDQWVALVANGTIPAGAAKVQLIAEFVQNASTDGGAVYLDDLSVGFGTVAPTATVVQPAILRAFRALEGEIGSVASIVRQLALSVKVETWRVASR